MAFQDDTFDELDDFDSAGFAPATYSDHSYLKGMWSGFRTQKNHDQFKQLTEDALLAHGMVQSFVNAFSRDGRYVVVFDASTSTAGTDMKTKFVAITPAPIADKNLTAEEAGLILTGLAVHEISHPRYGRMTAQAVEKVFPGNATAARLSNLLDDIRIERRFVSDYPGYTGIFDPTLDYVGKASAPKGGALRKPQLTAPVNLAISATRYPKFSDWSDPRVRAERDWWLDWAERGAREDSPKRHVDFIRQALQHIVDTRTPLPPPNVTSRPGLSAGPAAPGGAGDPDDAADESGSPEPSEDAPSDDAPPTALSDRDLDLATQPTVATWHNAATEDQTAPLAACSGAEAVEKAAEEGDTDKVELRKLKQDADAMIEAARNEESDGHGSTVDVNRSLRGITSGGPRGLPSPVAAKYIRNAIMQSRTGHTDHSPFKRHGRLDQRGLARIVKADFRIFEKRTAPSVGRYNIWVMVDASDSMTWGGSGRSPLQKASGVAHAMAVASQTIPTVRMSVWAWTDAFRQSGVADAGVALAWRTGQPTDGALRLATVKTGGTPDSVVMGWAARAILRETSPEEVPVVIFVSDGAGFGEMNERIAEARAMGVEVYGVSFSSGMDATDSARFGKSNYVPWKGSIEETARPLARLFARITGGQR